MARTSRSLPCPAPSVFHQPGRHRFLCLRDGQEAVPDYHLAGARQVDFCHTHGPEALRGHGIAEALVRAGQAGARVTWANAGQLRFVLREGRKRRIRRMCELVGPRVTGPKRVRIGRVRLGELPPGQWRFRREDGTF